MNNNTKTINGLSYSDILQKLQGPFDESLIKELHATKQTYIPVNEIIARLDEVLTPFLYDFTISDINIFNTGNQQNISCIGTLSIKNDSGEIVATRSSGGSSIIIYPNKVINDKPVLDDEGNKIKMSAPAKVSNDIDSACKDALKRCAKLFGIGKQQLINQKNEPSRSTSKNTNLKEYQVIIKSTFKTLNNDSLKCDVDYNNERYELIIWVADQSAITKYVSIEQFIKCYTVNTQLTFKGNENTYGNKKQLYLREVNKKDGK